MARSGEARRFAAIERWLRKAVGAFAPGRYLLAVSGGRDSMVLLDACARWRRDVVAVATFDHGTGPAARRAAGLVELESGRRELPVVSGAWSGPAGSTEAAWRAARWQFLAAWAAELRAVVVTAHTRDDQVETVLMRALRDPRNSSARGLAAMYAPSDVARPLLDVSRSDITAYASRRGVSFVDDPANADRKHLRNRIRLDLLPALERACPGFGDELLELSRRSAMWRRELEALLDSLGVKAAGVTPPSVVVEAHVLSGCDDGGLAVLWPAIAARAGVALDWRGTERLVAFSRSGRPGRRIPLSGGAEVECTGRTFVLRAPHLEPPLY